MKEPNKHMHPLLVVLLDGILLGAVLLCFALGHHVYPIWHSQYMASLHIPAETTQPTRETTEPTETQESTLPAASEETLPVGTVPPETEPDNRTPWQIRFEDKFTDEVIRTENSYSSPNVSVTIQTIHTGEGKDILTYYVADIYVASMDCFRTYVAHNDITYYSTQWAEDMHKESGAIVSLSGDYYAIQRNSFTMRNGYLYSKGNPACDICVLYSDGTMATYGRGEYTKEDVLAADPLQIWNFGPALLDENGKAKTSFQVNESVAGKHPRSAIGYVEPGHYIFLMADGRMDGFSRGMRIEHMAKVFQNLGCKAAYNLDGGASASITFNEDRFNASTNQRPISDLIIVVEPEAAP